MSVLGYGIEAIERGFVPDSLVRIGIRRLCKRRLWEVQQENDSLDFIQTMKSGPIALVPERANEQHYEIPFEFFKLVLGPQMKYSCCYFPNDSVSLDSAEKHALTETCNNARLENGQSILELGCGWGSLSLWMAEQFPNSNVTAVSNSNSQRQFIENEARRRAIHNLVVKTADMNEFSTEDQFDRIVSVEMFEHMRNYRELLSRISNWLKPSGRLFVHIFCHSRFCYPFQTAGSANWMGRHFFTGGIMPSREIFSSFEEDLVVQESKKWDGNHYRQTAEHWLENMDRNKSKLMQVLVDVYGKSDAARWFNRWRVFFLACSELFRFNQGDEWFVGHYLLKKKNFN